MSALTGEQICYWRRERETLVQFQQQIHHTPSSKTGSDSQGPLNQRGRIYEKEIRKTYSYAVFNKYSHRHRIRASGYVISDRHTCLSSARSNSSNWRQRTNEWYEHGCIKSALTLLPCLTWRLPVRKKLPKQKGQLEDLLGLGVWSELILHDRLLLHSQGKILLQPRSVTR